MAGFKAVVTRRAREELNRSGVWQRNFYERIIRDEQAFMNIWAYIDHNPRKWLEDQAFHPK